MKLVYPCLGKIGVQVLDLEIASMTVAEIAQIRQLAYNYKLVIFRNQHISDFQYLEFAKNIGNPQIYPQVNYRHPKHLDLFISSNISREGERFGIQIMNQCWYADCAFLEEPFPLTMVRPKVLPKSTREISYIDMQQVYQKLPIRLKGYIKGKHLIHEAPLYYKVRDSDVETASVDLVPEIEDRLPPVTHPSVVVHPVTEEEILYMSSGFTTGIEGVDDETSKAHLKELFAFIEREENIQTHTWQDGDILLWENRTLNHMKSQVSDRENSISYQIGICDGLPFYFFSIKEAIKEAQNSVVTFKL